MRKYVIILTSLIAIGFTSCKEEVKNTDLPISDADSTDVVVIEDKLESNPEVSDTLKMENGIIIRWFDRGEGDKLATGDVVNIDYKVTLDDGELVDGNKLNGKTSVPFVVGFGMQTEGWDIALKELKVGDFAEIFIPSKLARGEKGIPGLIPPNSNNTLKIRVIDQQKPTREIDGNRVYLFEESQKSTEKFDEGKTIEFHCMVSSESNPFYINTFRSNEPFKLNLEDYGVVPGLKKALINAKKADRMFIIVPAEEAYKNKGYQDLVKPNEDLFYNVLVMDVTKG